MLNTECEINRVEHGDRLYDEWDESDDEPLSKYARTSAGKRATKTNWFRVDPTYEIETKCETEVPTIEVQSAKTPLEFFQLFFSDDILSHCVEQTCLYALQKKC